MSSIDVPRIPTEAEISFAHEDLKCPWCGGDIHQGYGLAGGGMGPYWYCGNCDFFHKVPEEIEEEGA